MTRLSELNYPNAVTRDGRRKSWFIVALTLNGDAYCGPCADASLISTQHPEAAPVFADADLDGLTCGMCEEEIK